MTRLVILYLGLSLVPAGIMMAVGWRQLAAALVPVVTIASLFLAAAMWVASGWPVAPNPARVGVIKPIPWSDVIGPIRVKPRRPGLEKCAREAPTDVGECLEPQAKAPCPRPGRR